MAPATRRRGFTLPEVLVTIAIVGTLAAVLLPALNSQLTKGEASRASNDLLAVQTAINTFVSDVRRYPASLSHLTTPVTVAQTDLNGNLYPATRASKWKGPYLAKELTGTSTLVTGFGGEIQNLFIKSIANEFNGISYVKMNILPVPEADFNQLDEIIDETVNSSTGQLRWVSTSSGVASFYAVPVQ